MSEQEIADAKAMIGRDGIGCEPASATTVAGIKKLVAAGHIRPDENVVAVLTGHVLKDPDYVSQLSSRHAGDRFRREGRLRGAAADPRRVSKYSGARGRQQIRDSRDSGAATLVMMALGDVEPPRLRRIRLTSSRQSSFEVRVPASTANMGAGFDCLGLALEMYLSVRATVLAKPEGRARVARSRGVRGTSELPSDPDQNLIFRAMRLTAEREGFSLAPRAASPCKTKFP